jgi:hypothetical protein
VPDRSGEAGRGAGADPCHSRESGRADRAEGGQAEPHVAGRAEHPANGEPGPEHPVAGQGGTGVAEEGTGEHHRSGNSKAVGVRDSLLFHIVG